MDIGLKAKDRRPLATLALFSSSGTGCAGRGWPLDTDRNRCGKQVRVDPHKFTRSRQQHGHLPKTAPPKLDTGYGPLGDVRIAETTDGAAYV